MSQIKELLIGIPMVIFVFWVFSAPLPQDRIVRVCQPINWVGNLATSTTALSAESHTGTAVRWSDKLSYSCQYMVWRLFYQEDYNKAVAEGRVVGKDGKPIAIEAEPAADASTPKAEQDPAKLEAATPDAATEESK